MSKFVLLLYLTFIFLYKVKGFGVQENSLKRHNSLHGLEDYDGGYNVTNKNYWTSAVFTGLHFYVIGAVWLLCGFGFGIFVMYKSMNMMRSHSPLLNDRLNYHYISMFWLFMLFSFLAIVASGVVLVANESSLSRTKRLKSRIEEVGRESLQDINRVIKAMIEVENLLRPYDSATSLHLYSTTHLLAKESIEIQDFVYKTTYAIDLAIHTLHSLHLVVVIINLAFLIVSLVLLLLHWHPGFIIIIFICWILTALCWGLTGLDFSLRVFVDDTCSTFQDFEQDVQHATLRSMLPCLDPSFSDELLSKIGFSVHKFISKLNSRLGKLNVLLSLDEDNMGSTQVKEICDPFSRAPNYKYIPESCSENSIPIRKVPNIISRFTCYGKKGLESCIREGKFISENISDMVIAYSVSVQYMISIYPDLERLTRCIIIKIAFSDIVKHQCKPFSTSIRLLWASMLSLSIFMVISILIWIAKAYQEKADHFSLCSILPIRP